MTEEIILLKEALQKRTSIALDSVLGCKRLDAWLKLRGVYISYSTLSRIFGLATIITTPRERTLDELAAVLGYSNFKEFSRLVLFESSMAAIPFDMQFSFEHALQEGKLNKAAALYLEMVEQSPSAKVFSMDLSKVLYKDLSASKKAMSLLSNSECGRESFFLTFIDEDDLDGNYRKSLLEYFVPNATVEEKQFVELYSMRKDVLFLEHVNWKDSEVLQLENLGNIHLKARAIELLLIRAKNSRISQKKIEIEKETERAFLLFCECTNRLEELAVLGRFSRGVLYAGASKYIGDHRGIMKAMISMLNQPIVDFEFQIPIYALLNQLHSSRETPIPKASSWPNAYYSASVLLLTKDQRKKHETFFQSKVGIHKSFLYSYE